MSKLVWVIYATSSSGRGPPAPSRRREGGEEVHTMLSFLYDMKKAARAWQVGPNHFVWEIGLSERDFVKFSLLFTNNPIEITY